MLKRDQPSDICHKYQDDWSQEQFLKEIGETSNFKLFLNKSQMEQCLKIENQMMKLIKVTLGVSILSILLRKQIPLIRGFSSKKGSFFIGSIFLFVPFIVIANFYINKMSMNRKACYIQQAQIYKKYILTGDVLQMNPDTILFERELI